MKVEELKTLIISLSENEIKQLALIGMYSTMQVSKTSIGESDEEIKQRYKNISEHCIVADVMLRATLHNICLSDYDKLEIKVVK